MKAPDLFRAWKSRDAQGNETPSDAAGTSTGPGSQPQLFADTPSTLALRIDEPGGVLADHAPTDRTGDGEDEGELWSGPDPVAAPLPFALPDSDDRRHFKLDHFYRCDTLVIAVGWSTVPGLEPGLAVDGVPIRTEYFPMNRTDVAASYDLDEDDDPIDPETTGFILMGRTGKDNAVDLTWSSPDGSPGHFTLTAHKLPFNSFAYAVIADKIIDLFVAEETDSPLWKALRAAIPPVRGAPPTTARAHFDSAAATNEDVGGMASGWAVHSPDVHVWIEDDQGNVRRIPTGYRRYRLDVLAAFPDIDTNDAHVGFFVHIPGTRPGNILSVCAASPDGIWTLAKMAAAPVQADVKEISKRLALIETPMSDLVKRAQVFDVPILSRALALQQARWERLEILSVPHGPQNDGPLVSLIIPLYGRTDFVEHQLMEFVDDPWLRANAEVIYVLDDPRLVEPFRGQADELYKVYGMPFRWIWGQANRGFSGANNLGAKVARGEYLLFMNSDVFPKGPGWLRTLLRMLDDNPDLGAIGPRLLFADGGIQHAGMVNRWHEHLGIWINHHMRMGFDPSMDAQTGPVRSPLITGACVLISRQTLDQVGGWDTGYVIGDYEDSDLCLALRELDLAVAYAPEVEMIHLERQSFSLLGDDSLRLRMTLTNAARHQQRWGKYLGADGAVAPQQ